MTEEWRPVPGYEDLYEVSSHGRVLSHARGGDYILSPIPRPHGYKGVSLCRQGEARTAQIHALVLLAFVGPRPEEMVTRHLDGNPANNRLDNLRYGTQAENNLDHVRHGNHHYARRTHCGSGHPFDEENTRIRVNGARECRTCRRDYVRRWEAAREKAAS